VAQQIDREIARLLEESHARVRATLLAERPALEKLAGLLMEREVVDRPMLDALFAKALPAPEKAVRAV
jgi:cell division protease FtsH